MPTTQTDPVYGNPAIQAPIRRENTRRENTRSILSKLSKLFDYLIPCGRPASVVSAVVDPRLDNAIAPSGINLRQVQAAEPISWQQKLQDWVNASPAEERLNREIASERITSCIQKKETRLDLQGLGLGLDLTSLPDVLVHCSKLEYLFCNNNQLQALPALPSSLQELFCNHNQLQDLPALPSSLRYLFCEDNPQLHIADVVFANVNALINVFLSNTATRWGELPEDIRNNQNIYIDIRPQAAQNQDLNAAQSTHTASAHKSATENAAMLLSQYGSADLAQAYEACGAAIKKLPTQGAAIENGYANEAYKSKTAQGWIESPEHLEFLDSNSGVTVKAFIGLFWLAIHDEEKRDPATSLENAKAALVRGLYEIRRGYNLSADDPPKDNNEDPRNICAGGTFNKISEVGVSVIQRFRSDMVTRDTFDLSFKANLENRIKALSDSHPEVYKGVIQNDKTLTQEAWAIVRDEIIESIKEEFKDYPTIAGTSLEDLIKDNTDFENVLQYRDFPQIPE